VGPPAASVRVGNLPAEMTRFIGRSAEIAETKRLLGVARLVTLAGVSGVGKTRLALRTAAELRRAYPDGVWFVELSGLHNVDLLAHTVAEALHLPDQSARSRLDVLSDHLEGKRLLLVLDTCEHLVDGCAMLAEDLLRAAPRLSVLATSREPLDVLGEHVLGVQPLPVPDEGAPAEGDAVALFTDRAAATLPGFTLNEHDLRVAVRLCRRLDGIPLAIELAAVRLRVLSLEQIVERLDDRFRLLGTDRAGRSRHQTLRAAVAWSHELCTEPERLLWARLSVFPGEFDLPAAERICGAGIETLTRLVEKSIVIHDGSDRYRMLDTLREYGAERLALRGEAAEIRRGHRDWYADLAVRLEAATLRSGQAGRFDRLDREHANLRAALEYSVADQQDATAALRLVVALTTFWLVGGRFSEGLLWLDRVLDLPDPRPRQVRVVALCLAGLLTALQGDLEGAQTHQSAAAALAGEPRTVVLSTRLAGLIAFLRNDFRTARELLADRPEVDGAPDVWSVLRLPLLGALHMLSGDFDEALAVCERCMRASAAVGDLWCRSYAMWVRAVAHCMKGDLEIGAEEARETLMLMRELHDQLGGAMALDLMAGCAGLGGRAERSALLFGAADRIWDTLGAPMFFGPGYLVLRDLVIGEVRIELGEDRWLSAHDEGSRLTLGEAAAYALEERRGPRRPVTDPWHPLTRREQEVARLVADSLSNRQIAERLVIAKRTVDSHIEHILVKLEASSRLQIAGWVAERTNGSDSI